MDKFEYKIEYKDFMVGGLYEQEYFTKLGEDGWELSFMFADEKYGRYYYYWKRKKPPVHDMSHDCGGDI